MKPSGVVLCVVFAALALAGTVWVGRYRAETPTILKGTPKPVDPGPPIAPQGPYPKAVIDETEYNFGTLPIGFEGKHDYVIRNEGQADLVLMARKEDTTCSCTFGELSKEGAVKPGESVTVTLNWKIKLPNTEFRHRAIVRTNDPEHKQIELVGSGTVDETIRISPTPTWSLGEISSSEPSVVTGEVYSTVLEKFEIESATPGKESTKVEWTPMTAEQLAEKSYKSGYNVTVTVPPDVPLGSFSDTVQIKTSDEAMEELSFTLAGSRKGPLELLGPQYHPEANVLMMGEFPAAEGKEVSLSVFVQNFDDELKLEDVKQEFNTVQVTLEKDEKFAGKKRRYHLKVKVPPGPAQDRHRKKSEKVDLFFNHPEARQMRLIVDFLAIPADV
jgi:hypothetical protein